MTGQELQNTCKKIIPILRLGARFIPGSIDDRVVDYFEALVNHLPFLNLVAEDINRIGGIENLTAERVESLVVGSQPGLTLERGRLFPGDGSLLKKLMESLPYLIELIKLFS